MYLQGGVVGDWGRGQAAVEAEVPQYAQKIFLNALVSVADEQHTKTVPIASCALCYSATSHTSSQR